MKDKPIICKGRGIGFDILKSLGRVPDCASFTLTFKINEPVRLECEVIQRDEKGAKMVLANASGVRALAKKLRKFRLVEIT